MQRALKFVDELAAESTCLKRVTVCILYDADGRRLAAASNRCSPSGGRCSRMGHADARGAYPTDSECRWEHAERRAIDALAADTKPATARLYGHDFPCPDCEAALKAVGVNHIDVIQHGNGTGLRDPYLHYLWGDQCPAGS